MRALASQGSGTAPAIYTPIVYYDYMNNIPNLGSNEVFSPVSATEYNPNQKIERSYNYNFTMQHDIGFGTVVTLGYVGTFDRDASESLTDQPHSVSGV